MDLPLRQRQDELRQLVQQRSAHPRFAAPLDPVDGRGCALNPLCGDAVALALRLAPAVDPEAPRRVEAARCGVEGCALCQASADLLAQVITGCSLPECQQLGTSFRALLRGQAAALPPHHPLQVFAVLERNPTRARCAALPWEALAQALGALDAS
ncbi:MAG: iron-sulfur cluster assembly scaffold protein [Synechococcus sp.]|nr:iron-sulfur cluster assembly scaffold protein [Synechococcus sp.]